MPSGRSRSAKHLGYTDFPYRWEVRNPGDIDAMIVDAYANHYETLYTLGEEREIVPESVPAWGRTGSPWSGTGSWWNRG